MSNLSDLFFIFTLVFIMINRMNTDTCSFDYFVEYVHYVWMITWIKNVNNFQIAKVQPQGVAYKSVAYKKRRVVHFALKREFLHILTQKFPH